MAHEINMMLFFAGGGEATYASPTAVRGELYSAGPIDGHDTAAIEVRTAEGPTCLFLGTHCCGESQQPVVTVECERGRAVWNSRLTRVEYSDGRTEEWDRPIGERDEMVEAFLRSIEQHDESGILTKPGDGLKTVAVVNAAHDSSGSIHRIPDGFVAAAGEGEETTTVIHGIEDLMRRSLAEERLFSELSRPPRWAVQGESVELTEYACFPQRFVCE
jgi:predicted dehydrogenase